MERQFDIKLESVIDNEISIRVFSKQKVDLRLKDIKAFYQPTMYDAQDVALIPIFLDNNAKIKTFVFPKTCTIYTSLNCVVKDKTNKVQYVVRIPLNGDEVQYKQTIYEGA